MSERDRKEEGKEEARPEGSQGFADMCRDMMSRGSCDCCGPKMREMMSRFRVPAAKTEGEPKK
jgi:hypothetical protein